MYDVLRNLESTEIRCLDHGYVRLVDVMPRMVPEDNRDITELPTADYAVVQAARVSYGTGTKTINEDRGLIRYLMRHQHTTPFEMIEFKFDCKMPIFVARQWIRHRTANVNEYSGRYSIIEDDFYIPNVEDVRSQSKTNKQGGEQPLEEIFASKFVEDISIQCKSAYKKYEEAINTGVSKELARMILPVNIYTKWYWKIDLHNLFHFLALRCDSHAQKEIRVFADAILELITPIVPWCVEAWNDYHHMRGAMKLTALEKKSLQHILRARKLGNTEDWWTISDNKREQSEWDEKRNSLAY